MDYAKIITAIKDLSGLQSVGVLVFILVLMYLPHIMTYVNKKKRRDDHTSQDFKHIIERAIHTANKIFVIQYIDTISEQMDVIDRTGIKVKSLFMNSYKDILDKVKPQMKRDVRALENIVDLMIIDMKTMIKGWIKKNHLLEKTEIEFLKYIKDTTNNIIISASEFLDDKYLDEDFLIKREELRSYNEQVILNEIETLLHECLLNIREVAKDKSEEKKT